MVQGVNHVPGSICKLCNRFGPWCKKGICVRRTGRRTRLKHIHLARQLFTTAEWIEDFLAEIAGEVGPDQPGRPAYQPTLPPHRRRALAEADAILAEAGI